jgi:hypothetical protein
MSILGNETQEPELRQFVSSATTLDFSLNG